MRNFLNFMGKSLMVLVFSFLTLSVVLTSCSSSDDTQTNPNDLLVVAFKATGEGTNIENFARDKEGTKVLSLHGQSNSVSFTEVTITKNGTNSNSSFTINGRNVTTKNNTPVGEYSISYRITNGSTTTELATQEFTVYYSENRTFEAVVTMYQFNTSSLDGVLESGPTEQEFDGLLSTNLTQQNLTNVPYQFLVGSRLYQLSKNSATTNGYLFDDKTSKNVWRVCKLTPINALSDYLLPSETIENIWVRTKKYTKPTNTNLTITFYELKIGDNNDNSYIGVPESQTTTYPTPGEDMEFNREQI